MNLLLEIWLLSQRATMQSQIALMNPGGIRNDLDAGDTWGEIYGIQPFGNQLIKNKI